MRNQLSVRDSIKYSATLALLVGFAMTTPAVQGAFQSSALSDLPPAAAVIASVSDSGSAPAMPTNSSSVGDTAIACPAGYSCAPNPKLSVTSIVVNGPTPTVVSYRFNIAGVDRIQLSLSANGSYMPIGGFSATVHTAGNQWGGGKNALGFNVIATRGHTIAEWQVDFVNKTGKDVLIGLKAIGYSGDKQIGADGDALTIPGKPTAPICPFGYTCTAVQPTVSSVSPTKVIIGTTTPMTMYGSNFNSSLMIGITGPGSDTSVKPDSVAADGSAMTFSFPSWINAAGTYSVYAYNYGKPAYGSVNVTAAAPTTGPAISLAYSNVVSSSTIGMVTLNLLASTSIPHGSWSFTYQCDATSTLIQDLNTSFAASCVGGQSNPDVVDGSASSLAIPLMVRIKSGTPAQTLTIRASLLDSSGLPLSRYGQGQTSLTLPAFNVQSVYVAASNLSTVYNPIAVSTTGDAVQQFAFSYGLTAGNSPIFVPASVLGAVNATTTVGSGAIKVSPLAISDNDSANDAPAYFYIAPGQTKFITARYSAAGSSSVAAAVYQVFGLEYGLSASDMTKTLSGSDISAGLRAVLFH